MRFKIYKYLRQLSYLIIPMFTALQAVFTIPALLYPRPDQMISQLFVISIPTILNILLFRMRRMLFSWIHIDARGITNTCVTCKDIFIAWDCCVEIGIGDIQRGYSLYNCCIYFSKTPLSDKQISYIQAVKLSDDFLWVEYTKEAWAEVLKYVDESDIRYSYKINDRSHKIQFKKR